MSRTFLERFVDRVLAELETKGEIELAAPRELVAVEVADSLASAGEGSQLIATLTRALLDSAHVEELYVDDDELKERIEDLGSDWIRQ